MIEKIIEWSVNNRLLVILITVVILIGGIVALTTTPLDAIPDLSDVQVIIQTDYLGQAPQVVEDQITYPLTTAMLSVPHTKVVRGYSFFGVSFVYIIFEDGTDIYWARSRVLEYLNFISKRLPEDASPHLGPDATGIGWVFEYSVESNQHDLQELRSIQDYYLKYELMSVPGVAEVASIGGFIKQYQVEVDPVKLLAYNITLDKVKQAIKSSNNDVSGRIIEMAEAEFMIRGRGYIKTIDDIKNIPLAVDENGIPIYIKDVANVQIGPELRRGLVERDGLGEVVGGIIVLRYGENALKVINDVKEKLNDLKSGLPDGVVIKTTYDRSQLIKRAIDNLTVKLTEESLLVAFVIIIFLLHLRSSMVAIITLPLGILIAFLIMRYQGINANIMSLSGIAIAIGAMVDAVIIMIENAHKHLEKDEDRTDRWQLILKASKEVGPALFYSLLIITVSFLPVFTLQAQEGRLFKPLAFTKTYAMGASAILAITIVPVLMGYFIRGKIRPETLNPISRISIYLYRPIIKKVLHFRKATIVIVLLLLLVTLFPLKRLGSEFMPPLNEGDLLYMPTTDPGISIAKAKELLQQTDKIIKSFPEVEQVFGKAGRAETATDPAPLSMLETTIMLKQSKNWPKRKFVKRWSSDWNMWNFLRSVLNKLWPEYRSVTLEELTTELNSALQFPGLTNAWTMPIKARIDMLSTGIKTPVGIKLIGDNLDTLNTLAAQVQAIVQKLPNTLSVFADKVTGGNFIDLEINRFAAARYGLTVGEIQDIIQTAVGGMNVSYVVEGLERYPISVRYSRELRDSISKLKRVLVPTPSGAQIPIIQVADIKVRQGAPIIKSENARKTAWVYIDIAEVDIGTYVKNAKNALLAGLQIPSGYSIVWSGQFEYMERANKRLKIVIPSTLFIVFLLLYLNFRNLSESLMVMLSLPFALIGGIWFMYVLGYSMSVAAGVGFIALAGVAAETGVVMLIYLDQAFNTRKDNKKMDTTKDLYCAVMAGAIERVRPKMMTVSTTIFGLLPILWGSGTGSQVMKSIAAPMVGGILTSFILTLIIIPVVYFIWKSYELRKSNNSNYKI